MHPDFLYVSRTFTRNKTIALINALGLSVGITFCLVIYLIAQFELTFDDFHADGDRIYRVYTRATADGFVRNFRDTYMGVVVTAREETSGLEAMTHFHNWWGKVTIEDGSGNAKVYDPGNNNFVFAGPDFFHFFTAYEWLVGNPEASLREPWKVVLTESRARHYFGGQPLPELMGKEIIYQDTLRFQVSGIVADLKGNTDFTFTDFTSYSTCELLGSNRPFSLDEPKTLNTGSQLFVKVAYGVPPDEVVAQLDWASDDKVANQDDFVFEPALQPLSDLHFNKELGIFEIVTRQVPKESTIYSLIGLAGALLVIAVVNFINLATAQASRRAKEVGVKKVLGCSRATLIRQFLMENMLLTSVCMLVSIVFSYLAFYYFEEFIPDGVTFDLLRMDVVIFLLICIFGVSLLAGTYPALVLSAYRPARVLKSHLPSVSGMSAPTVRKALNVVQFAFAQVLVIGVLVVGLQIRYMLQKDLGFNADAVIVLRVPPNEDSDRRLVMGNLLSGLEGIQAVGMQSQPPSGDDGMNSLLLNFTEDERNEHWVNAKFGDVNYLILYNIKLLAGRNFDPNDSCKGYIINEAYMRKLGLVSPEEAIGKMAGDVPVIGVVKDFHTRSLHDPISPTVIACDGTKLNTFAIKLKPSARIQATLGAVAQVWKQVYPAHDFNFSFIDEKIRMYYEAEQRTKKLANVAAAVAILISCLGLFALSSFTVMARTKEIGIRKVLGATGSSITRLLSFEFLRLVLLAFIIAAPAAYYLSDNWLKDFAFRINLSIWIFVAAAVLSTLLAFLTVGFHTVKAARSNPVESLRHE